MAHEEEIPPFSICSGETIVIAANPVGKFASH